MHENQSFSETSTPRLRSFLFNLLRIPILPRLIFHIIFEYCYKMQGAVANPRGTPGDIL
jgi:hypothetical protein